jgi:hypothetical protein
MNLKFESLSEYHHRKNLKFESLSEYHHRKNLKFESFSEYHQILTMVVLTKAFKL